MLVAEQSIQAARRLHFITSHPSLLEHGTVESLTCQNIFHHPVIAQERLTILVQVFTLESHSCKRSDLIKADFGRKNALLWLFTTRFANPRKNALLNDSLSLLN